MRYAALLTAATVLLTGCNDYLTGVSQRDEDRTRFIEERERSSEFLAAHRIGVSIRTSGALRPGAPIEISATAIARRSSMLDYELFVLDEAGAYTGVARTPQVRSLASFQGTMTRGSERHLTATITFPQPGYYRIVAVVNSKPSADDPQHTAGDTILVSTSSKTLYLFVNEQGGRLTNGFEPAAIPSGAVPLYGSYGPFVKSRARGGARLQRSLSVSANVVHGTFQYFNQEVGTNQPVPDAQVHVTCLNDNYEPVSTATVGTDSNGSFSFSCATGIYDAAIVLRTRISDVMNPDRSSGGVVYFNESAGSYPTLTANNRYAAHIHILLNRYVPVAEQRFNRSRNLIPVLVHPTDDTFGVFYDRANDTIKENYTTAFGEWGTFVTMHEYGHAYHARAIEPSTTYNCNGQHSLDAEINVNCAFVEGFADFFGVWIAGDRLTDTPFSDWNIENQTYYSGKDGAKVEGAVAGFFYDLVDGTSSPDGRANETGDEDWWGDQATYPGSFVADVMQACELIGHSGAVYTSLYGSDDLVYCIEDSVSAYNEAVALGSSAWWDYARVQRNVTAPVSFSFDMVRKLWKRNFYGK